MHLRDVISKYGILFALIVLILVAGILSPAFLKIQNIINIFWQISYIGIIAIGMTFIMIGGGIDLSVGSFMALMGALAIQTVNALGDTVGSVILSILITIAVGALLGAGSGFLVTKGRIPPFVVTLGAMAIYRSLVLNFANGGVYMSRSTKYSSIGMMRILELPVPMIVFLIYVIIASIILERTKFGRYVYAIGANETAALYSAINVDKIRIATYVIGGISVSIAAILISSMMGSVSSSSTGNGFELDAIAAAVIGGTSLSGGKGKIVGTFLGALVLGVINNMLVMLNVAVYLQGLVKGLIIISAVFLQNFRRSE